MKVRMFGFATKVEALAFVKGVEFVNDSAVRALPPRKVKKEDRGGLLNDYARWAVIVEDRDG